MLIALWNHKLAGAQLHASTDPVGAGDLSKGMALVAEIDRVAARLGGDPQCPDVRTRPDLILPSGWAKATGREVKL